MLYPSPIIVHCNVSGGDINRWMLDSSLGYGCCYMARSLYCPFLWVMAYLLMESRDWESAAEEVAPWHPSCFSFLRHYHHARSDCCVFSSPLYDFH